MHLGWVVVDFQRRHEWRTQCQFNKPTCGLKASPQGEGEGDADAAGHRYYGREAPASEKDSFWGGQGCFHTVPFSPCSAHFSRAQCTLCYFRKPVKCQEGSQKLGGICRCFTSLGNFRHSLSEWKHLPHSLLCGTSLSQWASNPLEEDSSLHRENGKQDSSELQSLLLSACLSCRRLASHT